MFRNETLKLKLKTSYKLQAIFVKKLMYNSQAEYRVTLSMLLCIKCVSRTSAFYIKDMVIALA